MSHKTTLLRRLSNTREAVTCPVVSLICEHYLPPSVGGPLFRKLVVSESVASKEGLMGLFLGAAAPMMFAVNAVVREVL